MKPSEMDHSFLIKILSQVFGDIPKDGIKSLCGDASSRKYYRLYLNDRTWIIMNTGQPIDSDRDAFIQTSYFLDASGIPVPSIRWINEKHGVIVLEDLTDTTLQKRFQAAPDYTLDKYYPEVLNILINLQQKCVKTSVRSCPGFDLRFDTTKYYEELQFFKTHFLLHYSNAALNSDEHELLDKSFLWLAKRLAEEHVVFTHRDFHSRNLMLKGEKIFVIDFQDARLGLIEYDAASLLRDAYVKIPEDFIEEFLKEFYLRHGIVDAGELEYHRTIFSLTCIQRNIKALGTFGFQAAVKKKPVYLKYVPILAGHIKKEFDRLNSLDYKDRKNYTMMANLNQCLKPFLVKN